MKRLVYFNLPHDYLIQQLAKYPALKIITPTSQAARAFRSDRSNSYFYSATP
ncbi:MULTISPECIES: hypothetical protein [Calothrix]|uniref:Uncharacterized protein n=2 Tax=Calothrix TaxID=1186 RepID=A0ABR8A8L7_9CYAN|nr:MULTISPECIES: hypothetical protein [Calothrix]MBD2196203.1 hypothetical protein [Calothrix parietina FACHB-288]MBD2224856.1 hypothetical protein [Calothrix anomala FACHB-343]